MESDVSTNMIRISSTIAAGLLVHIDHVVKVLQQPGEEQWGESPNEKITVFLHSKVRSSHLDGQISSYLRFHQIRADVGLAVGDDVVKVEHLIVVVTVGSEVHLVGAE